jgi:uncharacterized protein YcbK (DUF882 family)
MITFDEMLHGHKKEDIPQEYQKNMEQLLLKVNKIREVYGKPMIVTSGIRTQADQMRINPKAPKSNHLTGHAIDISDPGLIITKWLKTDGAKILEEQGLYCEEGNSNWVHFQDIAPKSGHRWFKP